jgi:YhcH/YjgK/YiaL family protein
VRTPYSEEKDVGFYNGAGDWLTLHAGMFAILWPHDAHAPQACVGEPAVVLKVVVKIAV